MITRTKLCKPMMSRMRSSPAACNPICQGAGCPSAACTEAANDSMPVATNAVNMPSLRIMRPLIWTCGRRRCSFGPSPGFGKIRPGDLGGVWNLSHCDQMPRGTFITRPHLRISSLQCVTDASRLPIYPIPEPQNRAEPMTTQEELFFTQTGMERSRVQGLVDRTLHGADDGELFLEYRQTESFAFDDGRLKAATYDTTQGFGLRAVSGEATGYAHASELWEAAIARAAEAVSVVKLGHAGVLAGSPARTNLHLYTDDSPLDSAPFDVKVKLMAEIDAYARSKDPRVRQVSCSLAGELQVVEILRPGGESFRDVRPLVRLSIGLVVEEDGRQETGHYGSGRPAT